MNEISTSPLVTPSSVPVGAIGALVSTVMRMRPFEAFSTSCAQAARVFVTECVGGTQLESVRFVCAETGPANAVTAQIAIAPISRSLCNMAFSSPFIDRASAGGLLLHALLHRDLDVLDLVEYDVDQFGANLLHSLDTTS